MRRKIRIFEKKLKIKIKNKNPANPVHPVKKKKMINRIRGEGDVLNKTLCI